MDRRVTAAALLKAMKEFRPVLPKTRHQSAQEDVKDALASYADREAGMVKPVLGSVDREREALLEIANLPGLALFCCLGESLTRTYLLRLLTNLFPDDAAIRRELTEKLLEWLETSGRIIDPPLDISKVRFALVDDDSREKLQQAAQNRHSV